ncbi:MAG: hypothetical protein ACE15C_07650 [Phycisphaerae bacterium]
MTPITNPNVIEAPGTTIDVVEIARASNQQAAFVPNTEALTALPGFEAIRDTLSDRPLRRPNRSSPLR